MLRYSESAGYLWHADGYRLDAWSWTWVPTPGPGPDDLARIGTAEAVTRLHAERRCRLVPVAIIGPRDPDPERRAVAESLGHAIGALGVPVLCGGKTGVMEAAARGARRAGALTIGFVPDNDWSAANSFIDLPLATGLGPARNILIARAARALVAVGGHYGTITEAAYGLHFGKPVFGLCGAPDIPGLCHLPSVEAVRTALLPILLRLPPQEEA